MLNKLNLLLKSQTEEQGLLLSIEKLLFIIDKLFYKANLEKNVHIQPYEGKRRKTSAYASVTHFNIIDIQCHRSAIKQARSRDESESALLQNANTPSNGLLTLSERDVAQAQFTRAFL
ncbi:unnamed protein product, partial [Rotaria sordida]